MKNDHEGGNSGRAGTACSDAGSRAGPIGFGLLSVFAADGQETDRMDAWRERASRIVALVAIVVALPVILALCLSRPFSLSAPVAAFLGALYLSLVAVTIAPLSWHRLRTGSFLVNLDVLGLIQLATTQLAGSGRLTLFTPPLIALVLIGPRAGLLFLILNTILLTTMMLCLRLELIVPQIPINVSQGPTFWVLQEMTWLAGLVTVFLLLAYFYELQRRTLESERSAREHLTREIEERRRLEAEISRVSDGERRRLGAELHDGLCQHLTATLLHCSALEVQGQSAGEAVATGIGRIRQGVGEAINMAYDIARGLYPLDVTPDALVPALERMCRAVRERHGVACRLAVDADFMVDDPDQALHLFRIIGEAVTNAVRHARCTEIAIDMARPESAILVSVSDNGIGMESGGVPMNGLGLRTMAYRVDLMGGTMTTSSGEGRGLRVSCRIPVTRRSEGMAEPPGSTSSS